MPRSDDDYDLVHTYDQGKAGKSKTSRPAVRELGREGAATETILMEETGEPRTPPTGVRFLFYDQTGTLKQKNPDGSIEAIQSATGAPTDAEYVTTATDGDLSAESLHSNLSGADLHDPASHGSTHQDGGGDEIQVDSLAGDNGSDGQVLQTDGSALSFGSAGGGATTLIEAQTVSSTPSVDFTSGIDSDHKRLIIRISNLVPVDNKVQLQMRVSTDGGSTFKSGSSDYLFGIQVVTDSGGSQATGKTNSDRLALTASSSEIGAGIGDGYMGTVQLSGHADSNRKPLVTTSGSYLQDASGTPLASVTGGGAYRTAETINGIRFLLDSGDVSSGTFELIGVN